MSGEWHDACAAHALEEETVIGVMIAGRPVALFRVGGAPYALHDLCPHGQARLSDGLVDGDCVECPLHQGLVDIRNGRPRGAPVSTPTESYPARERNGRIEVQLP